MESSAFSDAVAESGFTALDRVADADDAAEHLARAGQAPVRMLPLSDAPLSISMHALFDDSIAYTRMTAGTATLTVPTEPQPDVYLFVHTSVGGAQYEVDRAAIDFRAGVLGIVTPGQVWRVRSNDDFVCASLNVDGILIRSLSEALLDHHQDSQVPLDGQNDSGPVPEELIYMLAAGVRVAAARGPNIPDLLRRDLRNVLVEAVLMTSPTFREAFASHRQPASSRAVRLAKEFMMSRLSGPLPLSAIASAAFVSPRALQLAFQKEMGVSPTRWLRAQRLDAARVMLTSPDYAHRRITEIAYDTGFLHLSMFSQRFREEFGVTPSAMRRAALGSMFEVATPESPISADQTLSP